MRAELSRTVIDPYAPSSNIQFNFLILVHKNLGDLSFWVVSTLINSNSRGGGGGTPILDLTGMIVVTFRG